MKIKYRKGYKYQLAEDVEVQTSVKPGYDIDTKFIKLSADGLLKILDGYAWDGPSGPCPDFKRVMPASLVHDALYQLMREKYLGQEWRDEADIELKIICSEDKFPAWATFVVYRSVDDFAGYAADPKNKRKILEAP